MIISKRKYDPVEKVKLFEMAKKLILSWCCWLTWPSSPRSGPGLSFNNNSIRLQVDLPIWMLTNSSGLDSGARFHIKNKKEGNFPIFGQIPEIPKQSMLWYCLPSVFRRLCFILKNIKFYHIALIVFMVHG